MLRVWLFSSNLALCIYELNFFFWLSTAYHLIVCGAELNQQTLRQNTSELPDKKAQLQTRFFFVCPGRRGEMRRVEDDDEEDDDEEAGRGVGWRKEKSGFVLLFWRRLMHTQSSAEWLLHITHRAQRSSGEMGHECCWENRPFLEWPKSVTLSKQLISPLYPPLLISPTHSYSSLLFLLHLIFSHHRFGISSLWSVWRYWPVTQVQCCVCSMMRGSSSPGHLTQLSGTSQM